MNNTEFMSEEIDKEMDDLIKFVGTEISKGYEFPAVLIPSRLKQMQFAYKVLEKLTVGRNVRLTYEIHKPWNSMGSIVLEAKELVFNDAEWFSRAAEFASNTEVYPLTNGNVRMAFTFHGLTKVIK